MKNITSVQSEISQIQTVDLLTDTFKGISSQQISRLKERVLQSKDFFADLWSVYVQLRESPEYIRPKSPEYPDKTLFIAITAEGGLSGDIDKKLVDKMLAHYDPKNHDIIVLGYHGVLQLAQAGVKIIKYYKVPDKDIEQINTGPIISDVLKYGDAVVYYQTYITLGKQEIRSIDLFEAVQDMASKTKTKKGEAITRTNYIFEPTVEEVMEYMESIMMGTALGQTILESKLAQYASRFNAMTAANEKAGEVLDDLKMQLSRSKRAESDERTREIINGMRHGV
ncbi:MAG: F0F1 ATP synthase subunit gamma [Candidatus Saccharimonadales bacterium]